MSQSSAAIKDVEGLLRDDWQLDAAAGGGIVSILEAAVSSQALATDNFAAEPFAAAVLGADGIAALAEFAGGAVAAGAALTAAGGGIAETGGTDAETGGGIRAETDGATLASATTDELGGLSTKYFSSAARRPVRAHSNSQLTNSTQLNIISTLFSQQSTLLSSIWCHV